MIIIILRFFLALIQCTIKFKYKIVASNVTQFDAILFSFVFNPIFFSSFFAENERLDNE